MSNKSVEALDIFSALAGLYIKLSGSVPELLNPRSVWFNSYVGTVPATTTSPARDVIEPTKDYFLDMATLARELEKLLIKHADDHCNSPGCTAASAA
jgi:hypothetical protein